MILLDSSVQCLEPFLVVYTIQWSLDIRAIDHPLARRALNAPFVTLRLNFDSRGQSVHSSSVCLDMSYMSQVDSSDT